MLYFVKWCILARSEWVYTISLAHDCGSESEPPLVTV